LKKITIRPDKYVKGDSFEASFVARPTTTAEDQRVRCVSLLESRELDARTDPVLDSALESLRKPIPNQGSRVFSISPFVAEELSRLDDSEVLHYLFHRYRYDRWPVDRVIDEFPPYVQIEPTSVCNFRCVFCYQTDEEFSSRDSSHMGSMSTETYKRVVDQIEGGVEFVSLASRGEPLMCRDLPEMLEYSRGKFLNLKVNTNASILTEERAHALLSGAVNTVVFSADAAEEPLYGQLRVGGKLDRVLRNIERFENIRQRDYSSVPLISRVSGVYVNESQDMTKMIELWGGMVDEISFVRYNPWENVYEAPLSGEESPCSDLWRRLFVWFDGTVNPCDTDYKSSLAVGHVSEATVSELWTGSAYTRLRQKHLSAGRGLVHPCNKCVVV